MADGQVKELMDYSQYASSRAASFATDATDARDVPPIRHSPFALGSQLFAIGYRLCAFQLTIPHQMHDIGLARSLLTVGNQQDGLPKFL